MRIRIVRLYCMGENYYAQKWVKIGPFGFWRKITPWYESPEEAERSARIEASGGVVKEFCVED